MNKRYEINLKDFSGSVKCPNCGIEYKLLLPIDDLKKRYTPYPISCFDGEPQGKGCMCLFECFVYENNLVIRESSI